MHTCRNCNQEYKNIGMHWAKSSCDYPEFSDRQREIATGVLMGDGCINRSSTNPFLLVEMTNYQFLSWLECEFQELCTGVQLRFTAEESAKRNRDSGFRPNASAEDYKDKYLWQTRSLPCLNSLSDWYSSGEKRFPETLTLTPLITRCWYVRDGSLDNADKSRRPRAKIRCDNESDRRDFLSRLFSDIGLDPTVSDRGEIRFGADSTEAFFDWIGWDPVHGFDYKWPAPENTHS
jgi:hypothetical protein